MTLTSIVKTVIHVYCSSLLFNTIAPESVSFQKSLEQSSSFPVLMAEYTEMTPTAPPEDRGSGR